MPKGNRYPLSDGIQLNNGRSRFRSVDREGKAKPMPTKIGSDVIGATQSKDPHAIMTATPRATYNC